MASAEGNDLIKCEIVVCDMFFHLHHFLDKKLCRTAMEIFWEEGRNFTFWRSHLVRWPDFEVMPSTKMKMKRWKRMYAAMHVISKRNYRVFSLASMHLSYTRRFIVWVVVCSDSVCRFIVFSVYAAALTMRTVSGNEKKIILTGKQWICVSKQQCLQRHEQK